MWKKYTVVLDRPDYVESDDNCNIYLAFVEAPSIKEAIDKARDEVFTADNADSLEVKDKLDYQLLVVFAGWQDPVLFGWQE